MCNGAICGPGQYETLRDSYWRTKWCFRCRKYRSFWIRVRRPVAIDGDPGWYGPHTEIYCHVCSSVDGDVGFGREREWEDG